MEQHGDESLNPTRMVRTEQNYFPLTRRRRAFLVPRLVLAPLIFICLPTGLLSQTYSVYFGDMHSHSLLSWDAKSGAKMPAAAYVYAKHVAKVDFLAISDHTNGLTPANYKIIKDAAAAYDHPDSQFVAIAGQELGSLGSSGYGHMNIFEAPTIAGNGLDDDAIRYDLNLAYQFVINNQVSAQFNHPSTENGNSNFANFAFAPLADPYMSSIEVINGTRSTNYERYYLLALQKGWHLGALGDQDNHGSHYGDLASRDGDIYLTGVLADSLTKPKLLAAIRNRRTYAFETNPPNDRIYLDVFTADGHWMGEQFDANDNLTALRLAAHAAPATNTRFRQAQLYRNGFLIAYKNLDAASFDWTFADSSSNGAHYYFAKLVQADGDLLWTSPIWVNAPGEAPAAPTPKAIKDLRVNFSDGLPQSFGWANVKVRGMATAGTHFGPEGPGYLQDTTGGVAIFGADFAKTVAQVIAPLAFEVEVTGGVSFFNGALEIIPYSVQRVSVKAPPAPRAVATAEIAQHGESLEGLLVRVTGARIVAGQIPIAGGANLLIDDGSGACTLRIDGDTDIVGMATPAGRIDITGIVSQFDLSAPFTEGHQLQPRRRFDIIDSIGSAVAHAENPPRGFRLEQNHPNPFALFPKTIFAFALPRETEVRLEVFNVLGQRVCVVFAGKLAAGQHTIAWRGDDADGASLPPGIYFYRLQAGEFSATRKMVRLL